MHEFSICERIVEQVLEELARVHPERLCKVRVVVGGLHQIIPEYLTFAYEVLTRDTAARGSALDVVPAPVVARCRRCAWQGSIALPVFRCEACRSLDVVLVGGKELYLEHLEVEVADDPARDRPSCVHEPTGAEPTGRAR